MAQPAGLFTQQQLEILTGALGDALGEVQRDLEAKLAALEARIAAMDERTRDFRYCGVWTEGHEYRVGNFATHDGAVWHCNQPTSKRPGDDNSDWQLAVKRGRNDRR